MNKLLVLLYLIFSYSLCKECAEEDCEGLTVEGEKSHYACVPKVDETCELIPLCPYITIPEGDTTIQCSDYPSVHPDKICIKNEGQCSEEYKCKTVPPIDSEKTCSSYEVSDVEKYICTAEKVEDEGEVNVCSKYALSDSNIKTHICKGVEGKALPCEEIPFCSYVTSSQTETDCSTYPLEKTNGDTICIPKVGDDKICQEKYLCDKVPKGTGETCQNFVLQGDSKFTHYCTESDSETYACKSEKYQCSDVPKIEGETTITCANFLDSTKAETHVCIEDTTSSTKQCKEMKLCSKVTVDDMTGVTDCSSTFYYDKETYACRLNEDSNKCEEVYLCGKAPSEATDPCSSFAVTDKDHTCMGETNPNCREEYYCGKVPKSEESKEGFDCSSYKLSAENDGENHICTRDTESTAYACKEEYFCEKANYGNNDEECSKYPVKNANKRCVKDLTNGKFCKEEDLCMTVSLDTPSDEQCNKYPVSLENIRTHICVKNQETTGSSCVEKILCDYVEKTGSTEVDCENYPVKNKETNICVKNPVTTEDKACKELMLCEKKTDGTTDEECGEYPVQTSKQGKYACIANTQNGAIGCIEEQLCNEVNNEGTVDCSKYPVSNANRNTHICNAISNPTEKACEEIPKSGIDCSNAQQGENDEQCSGYKVSDETKRCVKNTQTSPTNPCIEKDKCELKTTGATNDENCINLAVEKPGEQKCIKNPNGENCMLLAYCDYGEGNSDADCANFALKDGEKNECKKKNNENKCEEVAKKTGDEPGTDEESGSTKTDKVEISDENVESTDSNEEPANTDKSQPSGSNKSGEGNQDTSKSTQGTTGENEKDNNGNFINGGFGLLLISYLLFLF